MQIKLREEDIEEATSSISPSAAGVDPDAYPELLADLIDALEINEHLSQDHRGEIDDEDFAWHDAPDGPQYPCHDQDHLDATAKHIGDAPDHAQPQIKARAKAIAQRKGLKIPDTLQHDDDGDGDNDNKDDQKPDEPNNEALESTIETLQEAKWTQAAKDAYYAEHPENFADPKNKAYPIRDASDVGDAWGLAGHADHPDQVRAKIIAIAKRLKIAHGLPDTAQDFAKEAVVLPSSDTQSNCIARLKVCWIEDNVVSLNNRQYTQQAVDSLIASGQARIADSNALPLTCYLSHEDAELDKTLCLVGRVSQIWREGTKGMALIDIPDTSAGRDLLSLCEGGFIKSIRLRASDPQMQVSRNSSLPQVVSAKLQGIDFTTSPGLSQIARITDVLRESFKDDNMLVEAFPSLENTMKKLKEDGIEPLVANGVTVGVADTTPGDGYANRVMSMPPKFQEPGDEPPMASATEAHQAVHGHLANVLDATVAPIHSQESSALPTLSEAGRKIAMAHATKLVAAHDESAKQLGMKCEGGYESHLQKMMKPADDGMNDGDDDDDDEKPNGNNNNNTNNNGNDDDDDDDDDNSESFVLNLIKEAQKQEERKVAKEAKRIAKQLIQETYAKQDLHTQKAPLPIQKEPVKETIKQPMKEANKPMTPEEKARLLEELQKDGFEIKPPKTAEEKRQEEFDAMLNAKIAEAQAKMQAQFDAKLTEMQQRIPQRFTPTPPQRKSMVEGSNAQETPKRAYYRHGDYLREQLSNQEFREQLLDRSRPLPKDINIEHLLNELKKEYLGMYDARWGLTGDQGMHGYF